MFSIAVFQILITLAIPTTFTVGDATVEVTLISTGSVMVDPISPVSNKCRQLVARNSQLYHLSTENIFQSSYKGSLDVIHNHISPVPAAQTIPTFDVTRAENTIIFISDMIAENGLIWDINKDTKLISYLQNLTIPPTPLAVQKNHNTIAVLTDAGGGLSQILLYDQLTEASFLSTSFPNNFKRMTSNPNFNKIIMWSEWSEVTAFRISDLNNVSHWAPPATPLQANCTQKIIFSLDSSLMIIETDQYNPLVVLNTSNFQEVYSVVINDSIKEAHFLNTSNNFLIVSAQSSVIIVDLATSIQYPIPVTTSSCMDADSQNNFFTCNNNIIKQNHVVVQLPSSNLESQFYIPLNSTGEEEAFMAVINSSLTVTSHITSSVATVASSLPFLIYFLSFLNYFSMSSLYVLLHFRIPEHLYRYLAYIYHELNKSILELFGFELDPSHFSSEKVTSKRGIFFEVSSDFVPSNAIIFILMGANIALVLFLQFLSSYLMKNNYLRKILQKEKWEMIYGQIINVMSPLIIPWAFVMLESGVRDFKTKMASAGNIVIFFIGIVFPIYYFFQLLAARQNELISLRKKNPKKEASGQKQNKKVNFSLSQENQVEAISKKANSIETPKKEQFSKHGHERSLSRQPLDRKQAPLKAILVKPTASPCSKIPEENNAIQTRKTVVQERKRESISFKDLVTMEIVEQWYLCQTNFIIPCLVLLQNPVYFLVIIFFYSLLGVVIAFKKKERRLNSFVLSLYPFFFHVCFMVFYFAQSNKVLLITQLVCFTVFLLGSVHHSLTLLFQICTFVWRLLKKLCKTNKIDPKAPKKKKDDKNKEKKKVSKQKKAKNKSQNKNESTKSKKQKTSPKPKVKISKQFNKNNNMKIVFKEAT